MSPQYENETINLLEIADTAMKEHGFLTSFPSNAINQVNQIEGPVANPEIRDLRDKLWFSLDNDDTKDMDQLTYAEAVDNNQFKIFVAIIDVDALVKKDSPVDLYAQHNTISVYIPVKVYTMLPQKLSYGFTSLLEGQDRVAIIVEVDVDSTGLILNYSTYLGTVHNHAKLAYNSIAAWLDGKGPAPKQTASIPELASQIQLQDKIAGLLRKYRLNNGALLFETSEAFPVVKDGSVVDINVIVENRARNLIEDFMITANTGIARFLRDKKTPAIRRIVRTPKNWDRIVEIAQQYGEKLPPEPNSKLLEAFLVKRKLQDPTGFPDLSLTVIKLLGRGEYIVEYPGQKPIGHFNLSIRCYTHFTAPNRRFIDLINQRMLKAVFQNIPLAYQSSELEHFAKYCSQKEDDAAKVERQLIKSTSILYISSKINQTFDGIVTGASYKGTWVRTYNPPIEGKIVQGYQGLEVGQKIKVKLINVNIVKGFIDFARVM